MFAFHSKFFDWNNISLLDIDKAEAGFLKDRNKNKIRLIAINSHRGIVFIGTPDIHWYMNTLHFPILVMA